MNEVAGGKQKVEKKKKKKKNVGGRQIIRTIMKWRA